MFKFVWFATLPQLLILYFIELITLIYLWKKYRKSKLFILVILLFYPAIFAFLGKNFTDIYRIITLGLTLWISFTWNVFSNFKKGDWPFTLFFVVFSLFYGYSSFVNNDNWSIILSQFSRYIIAYCLWFIVRKELYKKSDKIEYFRNFTYDLILMQIVISISKLLIFQGRQIESIVGSISHIGGAPGTVLPILGFVVLWFYNKGNFEKKDWLFVLGLMLIGFLAGKRAIWFIMPLVVIGFLIYVPRLKMNKGIMYAIILSPLALYLGFRLTPTLNPENKVWGSFDIEYALDYADKYQFGDENAKKTNVAQGRGGATIALWEKLVDNSQLSEQDFLGLGFSTMYASDYESFGKQNSGVSINHKGSATGVFQTYITLGYIGILTTVLFLFSIVWKIKMKRIRWVILAMVAWEYFMYTGIIFRTPAFMFLIVYFVHYANYMFPNRTKISNSI